MVYVMENTTTQKDTLTLADLTKTSETLRALMPTSTPEEHTTLWNALMLVRHEIISKIAKG